jgi:hypothetical protein
VNDTLGKNLFGGQKGEAVGEVETHLVAKDALCACACAVAFDGAVVADGSE